MQLTFDNTVDQLALRSALAKTSLQYIGVQARSKRNLLYTTWEPDFLYQFPKSVNANLLNSMQR